MKSDGSLYVHDESFLVYLADGGDLMAFGKPDDVKTSTAMEARLASWKENLSGEEAWHSSLRTRSTN